MARSIGNIIADSLQLSLGYAERLLKEIPDDKFARFAHPGGQLVQSNHPAFVLGHLSLYGPRIVEQLGGDAAAIAPPARFVEVFSRDAQCQDDPTGTIYPTQREVAEVFFRGYRAALDLLRKTPDEQLQVPNPMTAMADRFPTLGSMQAFYVGGHMMMHLGQMSAWRRMQGLPPA